MHAISCCRAARLCAPPSNKEHFETQRAQLEARNLERRKEAEAVGEKLNGQSFIIIRQSGETGGSTARSRPATSPRSMTAGGFTVDRNQIVHQPADQDHRPAQGARRPPSGGRGVT